MDCSSTVAELSCPIGFNRVGGPLLTPLSVLDQHLYPGIINWIKEGSKEETAFLAVSSKRRKRCLGAAMEWKVVGNFRR